MSNYNDATYTNLNHIWALPTQIQSQQPNQTSSNNKHQYKQPNYNMNDQTCTIDYAKEAEALYWANKSNASDSTFMYTQKLIPIARRGMSKYAEPQKYNQNLNSTPVENFNTENEVKNNINCIIERLQISVFRTP